MKKKNYDEEIPGVVGVVYQNLGGHLLIKTDFYRDKTKKKIFINGKMFAVHGGEKNVGCFVGDFVRLERNEAIVNISARMDAGNFAALLTKDEVKLLNEQKGEFLFNGFIEQVNVIGNSVAICFRVTSRINSDGKKLRVDKLVRYCPDTSQTTVVTCPDSHFVNTVLSAPVRKALTVKYSRKVDPETGKLKEVVSFLGVTPIQNAKTFIKKNC